MHLEQHPQTLLRFAIHSSKPFSNKKFEVKPLVRHERSIRIMHPGQTAGHSCTKVDPNAPQYDNRSTCHVLAAMVAHTFNHRNRAGVPNREPLPGTASRKQLSSRRTIQRHIAQDHMLSTILCSKSASPDHQLTAGQSLAHKIIRLPFEHQLHPLDREGAKRLPRNSIQIDRDIRRKIALCPPQSQLAGQPRTNRSITIRNLRLNRKRQPSVNRLHRRHNPSLIERRLRNRLIVPRSHPSRRPVRDPRQHRL
jgi:hypothetical protein